jgi:O-methyltransferase
MKERKLANRGWCGNLVFRLVCRFEFAILSHYKRATAAPALRLLRDTWRQEAGLVLFNPHELFVVYSIARSQRDHGGSFVEVGVFRGASLRVIAAAKNPETRLFAFDTFEGLPSVGTDDRGFAPGMFKADETKLRARLCSIPNLTVVKGVFPRTAAALRGERLSFVHLDVDTYESTAACLSALYELLLPGGIMLIYDYSNAAGVRRAVDEFSQQHMRDRLIELSVSQALIIKISPALN